MGLRPKPRGARAGDSLRGRLANLSQLAKHTPQSGFFGLAAPNAEARRQHNTKHKRVLTERSAFVVHSASGRVVG